MALSTPWLITSKHLITEQHELKTTKIQERTKSSITNLVNSRQTYCNLFWKHA